MKQSITILVARKKMCLSILVKSESRSIKSKSRRIEITTFVATAYYMNFLLNEFARQVGHWLYYKFWNFKDILEDVVEIWKHKIYGLLFWKIVLSKIFVQKFCASKFLIMKNIFCSSQCKMKLQNISPKYLNFVTFVINLNILKKKNILETPGAKRPNRPTTCSTKPQVPG